MCSSGSRSHEAPTSISDLNVYADAAGDADIGEIDAASDSGDDDDKEWLGINKALLEREKALR